MQAFKLFAAAVVVSGLVTVAPAAAAPPAHIAGSDAPTLLPSIVNVRVVRVQAALERATEYVDTAQPDKAVAQLAVARTQLRKAWDGAKYVIQTAPPPVADSGAVGRASGAPVGGSPYADQFYTGYAVTSLQHDVASAAISLADGAQGTLLSSLSTTIFSALNGRDAAIAYIHSKDTAPAPARKSDAVLSPWAAAMAPESSLLDDELQQIRGTLQANKSTGLGKVLKAAEAQDTKTRTNVNKFWPPAPAG